MALIRPTRTTSSSYLASAPLSFEQERMWLLDKLAPGNPAQHICQGVEIRGPLDVGKLRQCAQRLMQRYEILRTTFALVNGVPQQNIHVAEGLPTPIFIVNEASTGAVTVMVRQSFDLETEAAWRMGIFGVSTHVHQLVLCMHHIICDGDATIGSFLRELMALYNGKELSGLATQYRDYANWQREHWTAEYLAQHLAYWKTRFVNVPAGLQLPTDRPRPSLQSFDGAFARYSLPIDIVDMLRRLAERRRQSVEVLLLSAFVVLLHRYARQPDITIGYPASGREHDRTQGQLGYFGNPLVLSIRLDDNPTFHTLLDRVDELFVEGHAHSDFPFQKLVENLLPTRDLNLPPLFQVLFSSRQGPAMLGAAASSNTSGLTWSFNDVATGSVAYDLMLTIEKRELGFDPIWEWNTDLFHRESIERMAKHFEVLLRGMLQRPEEPIGTQPILTDAELLERMTLWNSVDRTPYRRACIHHLIEEQVVRTPNACAVEFEGTRLTYHELNERSNQLAHHLQKRGIGPNLLVGLCMERSIEIVVAIVATMKAGGAYVPLDAAYPEERLRYMLADSQVAVVLTTAETLAAAPHVATITGDLQTIAVDTDWPLIAQESRDNPQSPVQPADLAYCLYTSGSTGQPKGALMEHGALANLLAWHEAAWLSEAGTRILLFSPMSFDVSFHEIAAGLCTGGTLIQLREDVRRNALALLDLILQQRIEKIYVPFIALQQLAQAAIERHVTKTPLREVVVGGEPLQITEPIARLFNQPGCVIQNQYGSTECLVVTAHSLLGGSGSWPVHVPVGKPTIYNTRVYVLDEHLQHVPIGVTGEIYADSDCLARGYHRREDLTAERFLNCPFTPAFGRHLYRLGDLGRYQSDGTIDCLGRSDHQVKIRGFRVELGEIEAALMAHTQVAECVVMPREDVPGNRRLVGYVVNRGAAEMDDAAKSVMHERLSSDLRGYLKERLPEYMVPAVIVILDKMPLTPSGKVNRRGLPMPDVQRKTGHLATPKTEMERRIAEVFQDVLRIENVSTQDSFFEMGGNSLLILAVHRQLSASLQCDIPTMALFQYPTIAALAGYLGRSAKASKPSGIVAPAPQSALASDEHAGAIAIIGVSCRFPGSADVDTFWQNLRDGVESLQTYTADELEVASREHVGGSRHVLVGGALPHIELFDAGFFGFSPREAALTDPQQRLLLECAWEAFETAGYNPEVCPGDVGVYVGAGLSTYLVNNVLPSLGIPDDAPFVEANSLQARLGSDRSYFSTRISYKLNLTGPSMAVQSACSTSLVAVHLACQALRAGDCELALAGGAAITVPQRTGYPWEEGMIRSPDGHCRAFDADAAGTVFSNGVGVVLLKSLDRAVTDGDTVFAVIRGSAVNNDGAHKVGYAAPSIDKQAAVIRKALENAGVDSSSIGYVETHGTATVLGDPVEFTALTQAFAAPGPPRQTRCVLGSVKTNIGHTDEAAGVAGLLKTVFALRHRQIPPTLHFAQPNPHIDFEHSPFYVNARLQDWPAGVAPRRAGISSFGMGGTNCHIVLEEAPVIPRQTGHDPRPLPFVLSAQSATALRQYATRFVDYLDGTKAIDLTDVSFTAAMGRKHFAHRLATVVSDAATLRNRLAGFARGEDVSELRQTPNALAKRRRIAFLFTGQGAQYPDMGRALFDTQPVFRRAMLRCDELLRNFLDRPLLDLIYGQKHLDTDHLAQTHYLQPALFALEFALAELWQSWGVIPDVVLGHSLGEFVAACVARVFSLDDALRLVTLRGQLMGKLPQDGSMLSVSAPLARVQSAIAAYSETVSVAAINAPERIVISGRAEHIAAIAAMLSLEGFGAKSLDVSHAFHSPLMQPVVAEFHQALSSIAFHAPAIPIVSNVTGKMEPEALARPEYWLSQMREPVQFAASMNELAHFGVDTLIELGPKPVLLGLARQCLLEHDALWLPSLRAQNQSSYVILDSLATLYVHGHTVDWSAVAFAEHVPRRTPLPTYPFQRERHWIDTPMAKWKSGSTKNAQSTVVDSRDSLPLEWLYDIAWRELGPLPAIALGPRAHWRIFADDERGAALAQQLVVHGQTVACIDTKAIDLRDPAVARRLFPAGGPMPDRIVYFAPQHRETDAPVQAQTSCVEVLHWIQASSALSPPPRLWIVTHGAQSVLDGECPAISGAPLWSLSRTLRNEQPEITCHCIDLDSRNQSVHDLTQDLLATLMHDEPEIAVRHGNLHAPRLRASVLRDHSHGAAVARLSSDGKYLITGGLGGLGLRLAEHLATRGARHLVLAGRSGAISSDAHATVRRLQESGVTVTVIAGNVGRLEDAREMVQAGDGALRGILHAAGIVDDGILANQNSARFANVMAAKVAGAWNLHKLTSSSSLDFFVLFSSDAALLGYGGQGNYAAANAFLDALAHERRAQGLSALSINWGPWAEVGMSVALPLILQDRMKSQGLSFLPVAQGLRILDLAMSSSLAQLAVMPLHWPTWLRQYPLGSEPLFLQEMVGLPNQANGTNNTPVAVHDKPITHRFEDVLLASPAGDRRRLLDQRLRQAFADVLGVCAATALDPQQGFFDYGLDSLTSIELRNLLQTRLGVPLPQTLLFTYSTMEQLTNYLMKSGFVQAFAQTPMVNIWGFESPSAPFAPNPTPVRPEVPLPSMSPQIANMSDEEAEALLLQELERLQT